MSANPVTNAALRECRGCGLLQMVPPLGPASTARCSRCATVLRHTSAHTLDRSVALTLTALVLLCVMCATTLMSVSTAGISHGIGLFAGPTQLALQGMTALALVIVFVTVIAPFGKLTGTLYVLMRLRATPPPRHLRRVFMLVERLGPWSMLEVFVFGVFVAYVKLGDSVRIDLDSGVFALLALTFVAVWADGGLDREAVWSVLKPPDTAGTGSGYPRRAIGCDTCGLVCVPATGVSRCLRCGSALHARKPDSLARTWALVIAAAILYVPANLYPVLTLVQLGAGSPSTILGGVGELVASPLPARRAGVFRQHRRANAKGRRPVGHADRDTDGP